MPRLVKVAVVGSGLAGLTAAHLLTTIREEAGSEVEFEVHLFEKAATLGMDSSSVSLQTTGQRGEWRVDVPMRSFQGGYYPQLIALYKRLGVAFRQADFSYSFSLLSPATFTQNRRITTTMIYNGASGREGVSIPSVFDKAYMKEGAIRVVARAYSLGLFILLTLQLIFNYLRLVFIALPVGRSKKVEELTFSQWAEETVPNGFVARWTGMDVSWRDFTRKVLVPLFSAVCTASEDDVMNHPIEEFLDYIWLTFGTHHYVVVKGVRDVESRLVSTVRHIHLASPIAAIQADENDPRKITIHCSRSDGVRVHPGFQHVIFATQATRAVPLLISYLDTLPMEAPQRSAVEEQIQCLRAFTYSLTIVVNHTDDTLMPDNMRDRRDLNLIYLDPDALDGTEPRTRDDDVEASYCVSSSYTMATHILSPPVGGPPHSKRVYQTTNPIVAPKEECVLSVARLERAVLTVDAKEKLKGLYEDVGKRRWRCKGHGESKLGRLQGAGRLEFEDGPGIWICGSYAYAGIPLLEGCVVSARNVVEQGVLRSEGIKVKWAPW